MMNKCTQALRRPLAFLAAVAFAAVAAVPVFAATAPSSDVAVVDDAGILSKQTETYVTNISVALQDTCGAQIGVYTTEYVGNSTMEGYAYNIFTQWGLGSSSAQNGVLLLLSPGDDDYYVMRGEGLENDLSVSVVGTILDNDMEPSWLNADYDGGTQKTVRALAERLCKIYGVSMDVDGVGTGQSASGSIIGSTAPAAKQSGGISFGTILLIIIAVVLVIWIVKRISRANRRGPGAMPPPAAPMGSTHYRNRGSSFGDYAGSFMGGMMGGAVNSAINNAFRPRRRSTRRYTTPQPRNRYGGFNGFDVPPSGPFGGFGGSSGSRPSSGGGMFGGPSGIGRSSGGHSSGLGGGFRSGGGSFHAGGGSTRGGGVGRRH